MHAGTRISLAFAAGAAGAVANVAFIVVAGPIGLIDALGIRLPPPPLPEVLYRQVAWGGLWGLPLATPWLARAWVGRGLLLGLLASLATLFVFFPLDTVDGQGPGWAGLNAGALMPVLVLLANSVWGLAAAAWYHWLAVAGEVGGTGGVGRGTGLPSAARP